MDLLILGGTSFLGRHVAARALEQGDRVTLFTRGKTNPDLFPEAEHVRGDRTADLAPLAGRRFDLVVDTSGYVPRVVRTAAETLAGSVGSYCFVSTISVYPEERTFDGDEDTPPAPLTDPSTEEVTGETYGPLKAACEDVVREVYRDRCSVVRPGLIAGPYDPTDRFTYWPARIARGGAVLAPGDPARTVQIIDARDLAAWMLDLGRRGVAGTFNATGEPEPMVAVLDACAEAAGTDPDLVWVDEGFLLAHDVGPWMELPLWLPDGDMQTPTARARAEGLRCRSTVDTARDTLAWTRKTGRAVERAGLSAERERELLDAWASHTQRR